MVDEVFMTSVLIGFRFSARRYPREQPATSGDQHNATDNQKFVDLAAEPDIAAEMPRVECADADRNDTRDRLTPPVQEARTSSL